MEERSDFDLLRAYAAQGREEAFAQLVSRYVDLVYSAARRQVRHAQLAEDVTQVVFMKLAQKARSIGPGVLLQGWLLTATRYAALDALRSGARRQRREQQAAEARARDVHNDDPPMDEGHSAGDESVEAIDAVLDAALLKLGTVNRDAVVLRYFQNKSFREVAFQLGMEEEAARQRVSRSLKRLRELLARSGVQMTPEALGVALVARGILPAPPHLAVTVTSAATKAALAVAGTSTAKGVVLAMAWTKTKIVAAAVLGMALLGGGAAVVTHVVRGGSRVVEITSNKGLPPDPTPAPLPAAVSFGVPKPQTPPYSGPPVQGVVIDEQGHHVAGAEVLVSTPDAAVWVFPPPAQFRATGPAPASTKTDRDGHFSLQPAQKPLAVMARGDAGYGAVTVSDPSKPLSVTMKPWAKVEGTVRVGSKPAAGARVQVAQYGDENDWNRWHLVRQIEAVCDAKGHYAIDRAIPGVNYVAKSNPRDMMPTRRLTVDLQPGKKAVIDIGGNGRPIVGHLPRGTEGLSFRRASIYAPQPRMDLPPDWGKLSPEAQRKLADEFYNSRPYKAWQLGAGSMSAEIDFAKDGTFRADDIPPGKYDLNVQLGQGERNSRYIETAGWGSTPFTVPPLTSEAQRDEPMDLGELKVTMEKLLTRGEMVPEVTGDSLEGKRLHLSDFRGRYVLLHLWSSDRRDTTDHMQEFPLLTDFFGPDHLTIVGANLDGSVEKAKAAVEKFHVSWPTMLVGNWADPKVSREFTLSPAMMFLIDPDGELVAKNADPPQLYQILLDRLRPSPSSGVRVEFTPQSKSPGAAILDPSEAMNAARTASFSVVDGSTQGGGGDINCLRDGQLPRTADAPPENFFFGSNTLEGRFKIDLGAIMPLARISSYSWHKSNRGPQVYKLYASDGSSTSFSAEPKNGTDPAKSGWTLIATVDTRPAAGQEPGGQYKVTLSNPSGPLGRFRYLLFETFPTETNDLWGNTFYSEITVTRAEGQ